MSGTGRAYVEFQSETLKVEHPAPLRAPSPQVQAEALRRHQAGDRTPLRSDGDPGWCTPTNGKQVMPGMSWPDPPATDDFHMDHPRQALAKVIASRDALFDKMARLAADVRAAEQEVVATGLASDRIAEIDRALWSDWADGDRGAPAPANSLQKRAEADALAQSAKRKLAAATEAHATGQAEYLSKIPGIESEVSACLADCVFDEADGLRDRLRRQMIEADRVQAQVNGLVRWLRAHGGAQRAASKLLQPILPPEQQVQFKKERDAIEQAAAALPDRLLRDPNAKMDR